MTQMVIHKTQMLNLLPKESFADHLSCKILAAPAEASVHGTVDLVTNNNDAAKTETKSCTAKGKRTKTCDQDIC